MNTLPSPVWYVPRTDHSKSPWLAFANLIYANSLRENKRREEKRKEKYLGRGRKDGRALPSVKNTVWQIPNTQEKQLYWVPLDFCFSCKGKCPITRVKQSMPLCMF